MTRTAILIVTLALAACASPQMHPATADALRTVVEGPSK